MATEKEIEFLKDNFDYDGLLQIGFYSKEIKRNDYDAQIKRVCEMFGFKSIFSYETVMLLEEKPFKTDLQTFSQN